MSPQKLAKLDRRAAEAGRERAEYVRTLIDEDLQKVHKPSRHVFASQDLAGIVAVSTAPKDNQFVRQTIKQRLRAKNR